MGFGTPPTVIEGNYSQYSYQWRKNLVSDWGFGSGFVETKILVYEDEDILMVWDCYGWNLAICKLSDGSIIQKIQGLYSGSYSDDSSYSFSRYFAYITDDGNLKIYKDGSLLQTIDLSAYNWTVGNWGQLSFIQEGKYLLVNNEIKNDMILFEGS